MPRIVIHGVPYQTAQTVAKSVKDIVVEVADTKPEYIHILFQQTIHLEGTGKEEWMPIVDVLWLGRTQVVQDKTAKVLAQLLKDNGFPNSQITFTNISASCFYDNGEHY